MQIHRTLADRIVPFKFKNKIIVILGSRQVGKTTLVKSILELYPDSLFLNCDEPDVRVDLTDVTSTQLRHLIGGKKLVVIDEAQRVNNIGLTLKLMVDNIPGIQIIATGSSSFDLSGKVYEPLTGRQLVYRMFPFSTPELARHFGEREEKRLLERRLIFGMFPDIVNNPGEEERFLFNLSESFLFKDILKLNGIRKPEALEKLLIALALQVGSEVSINELSQTVGIDFQTATRYLELLEKTFVIFTLRSFRRNLRSELKKSRKIYFWDNGVRNSIVKNFNPISLRTDAGALWENFMVSERLKLMYYSETPFRSWFWRTAQQQEIDYIEESRGEISAFELVWSPAAKRKISKTFSSTYPGAKLTIINRENYFEFVTQQ